MGRILTLTLKDLRLLWRDRFSLFWVFVFPLVFGLFFGSIAGGGGPRGKMAVVVVDEDDSDASRAFTERLAHHESVRVEGSGAMSPAAAADRVRRGDVAAYVLVRKGFGDGLLAFGGSVPAVQVGIDPARRAEAGFLQGVVTEASYELVARQFRDPAAMKKQVAVALKELDRAKDMGPAQKATLQTLLTSVRQLAEQPEGMRAEGRGPFGGARVEVVGVEADRAQPRSAFEVTFPSAMLWAVMGCMTSFAVSVVVERRQGTLLRLRMAPLRLGELLAGKGLACFLSCVVSALALLVVGVLFFRVRVSQPGLLALGLACTAFCFAGVMMFLAVLGRTEQAVGGSASAAMILMAMFGGGMIPLLFMPDWMVYVSHFSPVKWGILALEGAIWRGFSAREMLLPCAVLLGVGAVSFGVGVCRLARQEG